VRPEGLGEFKNSPHRILDKNMKFNFYEEFGVTELCIPSESFERKKEP
jgi:hypothetical protein